MNPPRADSAPNLTAIVFHKSSRLLPHVVPMCSGHRQVSSFSSEWFFLSVCHPVISSPPPLLTHILYQQPDTELLPDGEAGYEFFIFMPSKFSLLPLFPKLLIISCFFSFPSFFHPMSVFHLPIYFVSPHHAVGLFHYLEPGRRQSSTLGWNSSSCQDFRQIWRPRCVSAWLSVFEHEMFRIF